ncbi:uncharacterized protein LOC128231026 [Mya arenaria]|nr:uncharacterized protein LOC128231026 [Mya arenaria]
MLYYACVLLFVCVPLREGFLVDTLIPSLFGSPPNTVKSLDLDKYLGRWYQMYASQSVVTLWESGAYCITADYGLNGPGNVSVLNSERLHSASGQAKDIHGYATPTNETGKFVVHLETVPIGAPYWVISLGPATYGSDGLYQYSVVSDSIRSTLFVLARDAQVFRDIYQGTVETFLQKAGFTSFYNKYIPTYHGDDCTYNNNTHH